MSKCSEKITHFKGNEADQNLNSREISYTQASLGARAIITAAGPIANFVLAIIAYFLIFMIGVKDIAPIVGGINEKSLAQQAGIEVGDRILAIDNNRVNSLKGFKLLASFKNR